jgi:hypothetical protein
MSTQAQQVEAPAAWPKSAKALGEFGRAIYDKALKEGEVTEEGRMAFLAGIVWAAQELAALQSAQQGNVYTVRVRGRLHDYTPTLEAFDLADGEHKLYTHPAAAQGVEARDAAFEAVRQRLCKLQRFSFFVDGNGGVRRAQDTCGRWVEFDAVHSLFDPVAVDAAIAAQAKQGE